MYPDVYFPPPYYANAYFPNGTGAAPVYCYLPADYFPEAYFPCESEGTPAPPPPDEIDVIFVCRVQLGVIFDAIVWTNQGQGKGREALASAGGYEALATAGGYEALSR